METKLEAFRAHLEAEQIRGLIASGHNPAIHPHAVKVKMGRKYANVDTGCRLMTFDDGERWTGSGKYMVELSTGTIYGIKGYGVIHRGHCFGTLDTIMGYDWSGYCAVRLQKAA
jgi:hypothetical protein